MALCGPGWRLFVTEGFIVAAVSNAFVPEMDNGWFASVVADAVAAVDAAVVAAVAATDSSDAATAATAAFAAASRIEDTPL
jgi:hypothetical protein